MVIWGTSDTVLL